MKPKSKITRDDFLKIERQIRREEFIKEGAYNGKLRPQIIPDKKKEKNKRKCREKVDGKNN